MEAKELLKSILTTDKPEEAATGKGGEKIATTPPRPERKQGDYLPILAVAVGLGLLTIAALGQRNRGVALGSLPPEEAEEAEDQPSSGSDW